MAVVSSGEPRRISRSQWLTLTVVAVVLLGALVTWVPIYMARQLGPTNEPDRLKAIADARTSLIQLLAGCALLGGVYFTAKTFLLTRHTQQVDRFSKAIEQIGSQDSETVRTAGVYVLWHLVTEAPAYWVLAGDVLTALVRERASKAPAREEDALSGDVQAALTVLGRRPRQISGRKRGGLLDLRELYLRRADLPRANLEGIRLDGTHLERAYLRDAHMPDVSMVGTILDNSTLTSANLKGANLSDSLLRGSVEMYNAVIADADLSGSNFSGVKGLTTAQLKSARTQPSVLPVP